jgi:hypothetical protein
MILALSIKSESQAKKHQKGFFFLNESNLAGIN